MHLSESKVDGRYGGACRPCCCRTGGNWLVGKKLFDHYPEFGSYVYLGEMITNIPFAPDVPMEDECGDCTLCLDVCPTGAFNSRRPIKCAALYCFLDTVEKHQFRKNFERRLVIGYTGVIHVKRYVRKIKESIICISKHFNRTLNWQSHFFNQCLGCRIENLKRNLDMYQDLGAEKIRFSEMQLLHSHISRRSLRYLN